MTSATSQPNTYGHGLSAIVGSAAVMLIALGFYGYVATVGTRSAGKVYPLNATFLSSNGLHTGADVLLAGVPIGTVTGIELDQGSMTSHVRFVVKQELRLPVDSSLSVGSSTLTSSNGLIITPGSSFRMLSVGSTITNTCDLISLEQQVSQYIFGSGGAPSSCGQ